MAELDWRWLDRAGAVLVDDGARTLLFERPAEVLIARAPADVESALRRAQRRLDEGLAVAGYVAYEAGLPWAMRRPSRHSTQAPLVWLGVYPTYALHERLNLSAPAVPPIVGLRQSLAEHEYVRRVQAIRQAIGAGDVYQVNFTMRMRGESDAPAAARFACLRANHPVGHAAFVHADDHQVLSLSPELFLTRQGDAIATRPMKGTAPRGRFLEEDRRRAEWLASDDKSRAENLMIVDLMRNDLGRVCEVGSVQAPRLFDVERYPTVLQMTSDVVGRLRRGTDLLDVMQAIFPPGSVTGAPKSRALEIIDDLECSPRSAYCGAVGAFLPGGEWTLNVGIRTLTQRGAQVELGIGSGIVWDSDPHDEWREALLKARFLNYEPRRWTFFETMRLEPDGQIALLDRHMRRLRESLAWTGATLDESALRANLTRLEGPARVRIEVDAGDPGPGAQPLVHLEPLPDPPSRPWRVRFSREPVDSQDSAWFHKSTCRDRYDRELAQARAEGFDEVLHVNERGELTEGCISNLLVRLGGAWYTPPIDCGLLPGVYRGRLLDLGLVEERLLVPSDLRLAEQARLCNALRGEIPFELVEP